MTLFSQNTIFGPTNKSIKISNSDFKVISGANTLSTLPMCNVKINYEQYQRVSVQIPEGATNFILSFPMLGLKPTFIAIIPKYCSTSTNTHYLKWSYRANSSASKLSFTSILVLTGTSANPITDILIDNPNEDSVVQLEILVSAMANDYINDISAFLYLTDLQFTNIQTFNQTNSGVLAIYDKDNNLATTIDLNNLSIFNYEILNGFNRIIIDDGTSKNIILEFIDEYHTLQAFSALNWLYQDIQTRALPKAPDTVAPVITLTNAVVSNELNVDLSGYVSETYTKQDFLNEAIASVIDDIDGTKEYSILNVKFFNDNDDELSSIIDAGTFTAEFKIKDFAGNESSVEITLNVVNIFIDTIPPVVTLTTNVTSSVIDQQLLSDYGGIINYNDLKILCVLSIVDNVDGIIPLSDMTIQILDNTLSPIPSITTTGVFDIILLVSDSSNNQTIVNLALTVL